MGVGFAAVLDAGANVFLIFALAEPAVGDTEFNRGRSVVRSPVAFHGVGTNFINLKWGNGPKSLSRLLKS